jgi:adenine-specific DNA-methyltransferase
MSKSLLEQLPLIVAAGKKQAEQILEGLESRHRVSLQTREIVMPAKDAAHGDWIKQAMRADSLVVEANSSPVGADLSAQPAPASQPASQPAMRRL